MSGRTLHCRRSQPCGRLPDKRLRNTGYLVISPDYFYGEQVAELNKTPGFTLSDFIPKWLVKVDDGQGNQVPKTTQLLREWMPRVKEMFGKPDTKYGIVGFCFGCPYVLDYCRWSAPAKSP